MKPVQFAFWKLKCCWKGTVDGVMAAVMHMLIGRCCILGVALRTPFLHTPAILWLEKVISRLFTDFHLLLLNEGGCLASCIRQSWLVSAHNSIASPSGFVLACSHWVLWLLKSSIMSRGFSDDRKEGRSNRVGGSCRQR